MNKVQENLEAGILDVSDLEEPFQVSDTPIEARPRHTCPRCAGSGKWSGGTNRYNNSDCIPCRGRGYFYTSHKDRLDRRNKAKERKVNNLKNLIAEFKSENEDIYNGLARLSGWHNIGISLYNGIHKYGSLTDKQLVLAKKLVSEDEARIEKRNKDRAERTKEVDLGNVKKIFENANQHIKRPKFRFEDIVISLAPSHGANAGALYVKSGEDYLGKVIDGTFFGTSRSSKETLEKLTTIARDPLESAVAYGRKTGQCACCGRELTKHESIDRGIGPVCATRFGLG